MKYINSKDVKKPGIYELTAGGITATVSVIAKKVGYGYKRFFECPICGTHRAKLYVHKGNFICESCLPINILKELQCTTKGGTRYLNYRITRLAERYGVEIAKVSDYRQLEFIRPERMKDDKWENIARRLQILQSFRYQSLSTRIRSGQRKIYRVKDINYVLKNCLYIYTLEELRDYGWGIDWEGVINMHKDLSREAGLYDE